MTAKSPHLHREANLIQMLDPLSTDWNQALPAPDSTVTSKLVAALDFTRLNTLFENFLQVMNVPIALIDLHGKVLASSRWQRACIQFHRQAETTLQRCLESDRELALQLEQGKNYSIYRCRNGLVDCATPIVLEGEHIANLFIGQFLLQEPDLNYFTEQASNADFDKNDYLAALAEVPIVDEAKLPAMLNMLASLALQITELSLANNRYQHSLAQTERQVALRTQELTLQNQILSQISEGAELKTVLHNLVAQVELLHPNMLCSILLLDEDGKTLRHGAAPSLPDAYNQAIDGVQIGAGVGSCGTAAFSGETVIVSDIESHPYWQPYRALADIAKVKSCWSQPVKNAQGKVLGTFAIYQRCTAEPSAELLEKIKTYGNLAELAISRSLSSAQIRRLAFYDSLTGLANRRLLQEHLTQAMALSQRSQKYCGLMFIDLDNFKPVNDIYGHRIGDGLLTEVAYRLQTTVRQADTVARFGGDEFIVLLREIDTDMARSRQHMQRVAQKISQTLSRPYPLDEQLMHQCACSIGLVLFKGDTDCDELIRHVSGQTSGTKPALLVSGRLSQTATNLIIAPAIALKCNSLCLAIDKPCPATDYSRGRTFNTSVNTKNKRVAMKKSLLVLALASSFAMADEGMWMPQQLPQIATELKAAGLALDPADLTKLTEFPAAAIVSLGGCSASFVSPNGLVATNHHCVYGSIAHNSTPENDLLANGFLAKTLSEEVPAAPGSRIFVTKAVDNVSDKVIDAATAKLTGKKRIDAIEANQKAIVAECEKDAGHRCTVAAYYGSLEFYLIKQLEIKDVRLVHAPAEGVGKFGGDTDNWMWPRHTGDYSFYRAYVSPEGKSADYSTDNVPYKPDFHLTLAKDGVKEGDFVMAMGYPGRTNRHRLPSEVSETFEWAYPNTVSQFKSTLDIIAKQTANDKDAELKYASRVAGLNNYMKNRQGMLDSFADSDFLIRKQAEHSELTKWVNSSRDNKKAYADDLKTIEKLLKQSQEKDRKDYLLDNAKPRLLTMAGALYRLAEESTKPDAERKAGFQSRDLPRYKAFVAGMERNFAVSVEKALDLYNLSRYAAQPKKQRDAEFDKIMGIKDGMSEQQLAALIDSWYANTGLTALDKRNALLEMTPEQIAAVDDSFVKAAVALHKWNLKQEAAEEELAGKIQQAYASYMRAKIAFMQSKGQAVYPDANSTLRVTYGNVKGRGHGNEDGNAWAPFTTLRGITAKATGEGEFNAPKSQLDAIKAKQYGPYKVESLNSVPVNFLATLDITGGNSGSAVLNNKAELVGLAFDGTLDSIISDWDYNPDNTRSIQVDHRFMLWQMQLDGADNLLKEMGVK